MSNFPDSLQGKTLISCFLLLSFTLIFPTAWGQQSTSAVDIYAENDPLSMGSYMQRVVEFNETVQGKLLGFQAARHMRRAELGTFEPAFSATGEWVDRRQPNDPIDVRSNAYAQELFNAAINGLPTPSPDIYPHVYEERNRRYSTGVEMLTPLGTRLRVGATGAQIRNNSPDGSDPNQQQLGSERSGTLTSLGISVEQPLLKGLGFASNLASLRLAARQSEIAFQDYRRQLMQVVAEAELAYWDLYYAQQELQLTGESVELAETLLSDSQASHDAGRGSMLDVLEAEAGVALRKTRQSDSLQKCVEAMNRLASFFGGVPRQNGTGFVAVDAPVSDPVETSFQAGIRTAYHRNPDLLKARLQKEQERIRLGYAKNQRLPELNLTAGVDMSGHGQDWKKSAEDVKGLYFPAWQVGLVFRVPIWGDVRGKNELRASQLRLMEIERNEANLLNQMRAGCDTAERRVESSYTTARSLERVVEFRENLLQTRMQSRDIGRMDARSVLEAEQELFVAKLEQLQSEIEYQRALLELQIITGNLLDLRGLEVSFGELDYRTRRWVDGAEVESTGLTYMKPDLTRLADVYDQPFEGDSGKMPWMGIDWGHWENDLPYEATEKEELQNDREKDSNVRRSRRFGSNYTP